jgi:hypothetical protein
MVQSPHCASSAKHSNPASLNEIYNGNFNICSQTIHYINNAHLVNIHMEICGFHGSER